MYSPASAQVVRNLRATTSLVMPGRAGENGGTVAIHGKNRYYYATLAGNKTMPLAFFNSAGQRMSPPDLAVLYDVRGMWYDATAKTFHANGYGKNGWCRYVMDEEGIPYDVASLFEGQLQPFPQSAGAFSPKENIVYFLKGSAAVAYDAASGKESPGKIKIFKVGFTVKNPPPANLTVDTFGILPDHNSTTIIYTGLANAEFGLLNVKKKAIELYSGVTGLMTQLLQLPPEAVVKDRLNFAFCNNLYWLYDNSKRTWTGYR